MRLALKVYISYIVTVWRGSIILETSESEDSVSEV